MNNLKTFAPNQVITLYNRRVDKKVAGTLYVNKEPEVPKVTAVGTVQLEAKKWLKQRYEKRAYTPGVEPRKSVFKTFAVFCFVLFFLGFVSLVLPVASAEVNLRLAKSKVPAETVALPKTGSSDDQILEGVNSQEFRITIPKINLEAKVIENVDPATPEIYKEQLKHGVAHAKGSDFPGQGTTFIFAHSTDSIFNILNYDAKFYGVKELQNGDVIYLYFQGKRYKYIVENMLVSDPRDLGTIRNSHADLILSTCWPPGTDWQRLITFAKLEGN